MTNMTLVIPEDLKKIMEKHNEVKWSEVARRAMWEHARHLELMDKLVSKSKLTDKEALDIGRKIKKEVARRHGLVRQIITPTELRIKPVTRSDVAREIKRVEKIAKRLGKHWPKGLSSVDLIREERR